jgi:hypothetical protein
MDAPDKGVYHGSSVGIVLDADFILLFCENRVACPTYVENSGLDY